jgi:tartrate dehydrogenase/decarboxylase / D-malate dehydrogenase
MKTFKIAVIPGDGIGKEVILEGLKVLNKVAQLNGHFKIETTFFPWGCDYYLEHGIMMVEDGLEQLKKFDAIYLGSIGAPSVPDHISLKGVLLKIRKGFDLYVNLRPIVLLDGAQSPLNNVSKSDIDMLFVRENSEGEYADSGSWLYKGQAKEMVIQNSVFSREGCERIMRYAYDLARSKNKTLTSISKANALNYSMVFWDQIFSEIGKEYPDVKTHMYLVDAASMFMIKDPKRFQVVVASNLFGDILTDLGAAIAGGIGLAAGANLNPERKYPPMFEPIHGSANDITGKGIANPLAAIWSISQMLDYFGYEKDGALVLSSIEKVLKEAKVVTVDMGGHASTAQTGDEVVRQIDKLYQS